MAIEKHAMQNELRQLRDTAAHEKAGQPCDACGGEESTTYTFSYARQAGDGHFEDLGARAANICSDCLAKYRRATVRHTFSRALVVGILTAGSVVIAVLAAGTLRAVAAISALVFGAAAILYTVFGLATRAAAQEALGARWAMAMHRADLSQQGYDYYWGG
jgi:hypothetical protein